MRERSRPIRPVMLAPPPPGAARRSAGDVDHDTDELGSVDDMDVRSRVERLESARRCRDNRLSACEVLEALDRVQTERELRHSMWAQKDVRRSHPAWHITVGNRAVETNSRRLYELLPHRC